jgi:hypothetical protein
LKSHLVSTVGKRCSRDILLTIRASTDVEGRTL